jgi:hypothetical protein
MHFACVMPPNYFQENHTGDSTPVFSASRQALAKPVQATLPGRPTEPSQDTLPEETPQKLPGRNSKTSTYACLCSPSDVCGVTVFMAHQLRLPCALQS